MRETSWQWSKERLGVKEKQLRSKKYDESAARPIYRTISNFLNNVISVLQILRLVMRHQSLLAEWENWQAFILHHRGRFNLPKR